MEMNKNYALSISSGITRYESRSLSHQIHMFNVDMLNILEVSTKS